MKNRTDDIDSWPAPQRLGMKLPINPPTKPPVYVGPLRTNPSSDNSTAETMNCSGYGQTADGLVASTGATRGLQSRSNACASVPIVNAWSADPHTIVISASRATGMATVALAPPRDARVAWTDRP